VSGIGGFLEMLTVAGGAGGVIFVSWYRPLAPRQEGYRAEHATCWRFASSVRHPLVVSDRLQG
jgi:hypothetical protein